MAHKDVSGQNAVSDRSFPNRFRAALRSIVALEPSAAPARKRKEAHEHPDQDRHDYRRADRFTIVFGVGLAFIDYLESAYEETIRHGPRPSFLT